MTFFIRQKVQISSKILPQIPNFASFYHRKMRPFQQCITVAAVNLFYEVLPKQFEALILASIFSKEKKTSDC